VVFGFGFGMCGMFFVVFGFCLVWEVGGFGFEGFGFVCFGFSVFCFYGGFGFCCSSGSLWFWVVF
jgi:hypothetical protein